MFTKTGRQANFEMAEMQGAIYQKRLQNGNIALLNEHKTGDTFLLIKQDGSVDVKESIKTAKSKQLLSFVKTYYDKWAQKEKEIKKAVFYAMPEGKIEEIVQKTTNFIDGSSELKVITAGNRKSEFPATRLAGSLHPSMAKKVILPDGTKIYTESYPQI